MKKTLSLSILLALLISGTSLAAEKTAEPAKKDIPLDEVIVINDKTSEPAKESKAVDEAISLDDTTVRSVRRKAYEDKTVDRVQKADAIDETVAVEDKAVEIKIPDPPKPDEVVWETVGSNRTYDVYFDSRSLKYDEKTGIITVLNRWVNKNADPKGARETWLVSEYDVRLKTCADEYQYTMTGTGKELAHSEAPDTSWYALSPATLGMALCNALNGYLLNN